MKACFYNQKNHCVSKLTREHVISLSVLKVLDGENIDNIVKADIYGNKMLFNHDPTIKDVCQTCNNSSLTSYDEAGKELIINIINFKGTTPISIPFNKNHLGWIIKSHINFFRVIKNKQTGEPFKVKQEIKNCLIKNKFIPSHYLSMFARNLDNTPTLWDGGGGKTLPNLHYNSKLIIPEMIVISRLVTRQLETILLIPSDGNYKNFDKRVGKAIRFLELWGGQYEKIDINNLQRTGRLKFKKIFTIEEITPFLGKAFKNQTNKR
ncbi:hypothetical protein [Serratia fonticola]